MLYAFSSCPNLRVSLHLIYHLKNVPLFIKYRYVEFYFVLGTLFSSVAQSCPTLLQPHESQHARLPCPSPTPGVYRNSCPLSQWCHLAISSSVAPFSSCPQSLPASGSFPMSQLFTWGGQSTGVSASASVLPKMLAIQWWARERSCHVKSAIQWPKVS